MSTSMLRPTLHFISFGSSLLQPEIIKCYRPIQTSIFFHVSTLRSRSKLLCLTDICKATYLLSLHLEARRTFNIHILATYILNFTDKIGGFKIQNWYYVLVIQVNRIEIAGLLTLIK